MIQDAALFLPAKLGRAPYSVDGRELAANSVNYVRKTIPTLRIVVCEPDAFGRRFTTVRLFVSRWILRGPLSRNGQRAGNNAGFILH
jgi:hypothetical protein